MIYMIRQLAMTKFKEEAVLITAPNDLMLSDSKETGKDQTAYKENLLISSSHKPNRSPTAKNPSTNVRNKQDYADGFHIEHGGDRRNIYVAGERKQGGHRRRRASRYISISFGH